ncbi:MAG TPA: DUF411 domain-containing protein [Candidatus Paceibacterota bacterium]|nr:DUF411 domain-containing protein [Candidatus Paceibacterota bacterium]
MKGNTQHRIYGLVIGGLLPHFAFAHGAYALDERIAAFWGSPLALIAAALLVGTLGGGVLYVRKRNVGDAWRFGAAFATLSAMILFALASGSTEPAPSALGEGALTGAVATVYKSATCGCCGGYIEELKRQGATVETRVLGEAELTEFKRAHGIAEGAESCHTSIIDGYVVEGHVPIEAVVKLRAERPASTTGIALPGMPSGTPGMPGPKRGIYDIRTLDGSEFMKI